MEERHIQERFQLNKQQVKEVFFLQRHQVGDRPQGITQWWRYASSRRRNGASAGREGVIANYEELKVLFFVRRSILSTDERST